MGEKEVMSRLIKPFEYVCTRYRARDAPSLKLNCPRLIFCFVVTQLLLQLVSDEEFVVFQVLLDVHFEFDHVVQHPHRFCVQLFPKGI